VDVVLLPFLFIAVLFPVSTHTNGLARGLIQRNHIGQLDSRGFPLVIHVLKARQVIVHLKLKQDDLLLFPTGL